VSVETVTLEKLVGKHRLDAVDMSSEKVAEDGWPDSLQDANVLRFRLDGRVYTAIEDPNDGYRSSMRNIFVSDATMSNSFEPIEVLARMSETYGDNILELVDCLNGKVVLRVGTENSDDYYPSFVSDWRPKDMNLNDRLTEAEEAHRGTW